MIRAGPPIILRFFGESSKNSTHSFRFKTAAFLLGDGRLNYGRENVVQAYYMAHVWRGVYVRPGTATLVLGAKRGSAYGQESRFLHFGRNDRLRRHNHRSQTRP